MCVCIIQGKEGENDQVVSRKRSIMYSESFKRLKQMEVLKHKQFVDMKETILKLEVSLQTVL